MQKSGNISASVASGDFPCAQTVTPSSPDKRLLSIKCFGVISLIITRSLARTIEGAIGAERSNLLTMVA
jgi:hypothetical protein